MLVLNITPKQSVDNHMIEIILKPKWIALQFEIFLKIILMLFSNMYNPVGKINDLCIYI